VPPLPSAMMCGKRIVELESLIYTLAKIVLANACKLGYKLGYGWKKIEIVLSGSCFHLEI
jgi:hypothetical protein